MQHLGVLGLRYMNPKTLVVLGPRFLNQAPTLGLLEFCIQNRVLRVLLPCHGCNYIGGAGAGGGGGVHASLEQVEAEAAIAAGALTRKTNPKGLCAQIVHTFWP